MNESTQKLQIVLADTECAGRVVVSLDAFFHFNHLMNVGLNAMVEKWSHSAAPQALVSERRRIAKRPK